MLIECGNLHARIVRATDDERSWLREYLSFEDTRAKFAKKRYGSGDGRVRMFDIFTGTFPTGLLPLVRKAGPMEGFQIDVLDSRKKPCEPDWTVDLSWLRDYQLAAVQKAVTAGRGIISAPTGSGKTELTIALHQVLKCRWLFLVHRTTLVEQAAERFNLRTGQVADVIGEGRWDSTGASFTCASFQSIYSALKKKDPRVAVLLGQTEGLLVDECFPAGTLVGGKPIETIREGMVVPSYDETSKKIITKTVVRRYVSRPSGMVRVHLSDGQSIACTPGHQFMTEHGWHPAYCLCGENMLSWGNYDQTTHESDPSAPLQPLRGNDLQQQDGSISGGVLQAMPQVSPGRTKQALEEMGNMDSPRRADSDPRASLRPMRNTSTENNHQSKSESLLRPVQEDSLGGSQKGCAESMQPMRKGDEPVGSAGVRTSTITNDVLLTRMPGSGANRSIVENRNTTRSRSLSQNENQQPDEIARYPAEGQCDPTQNRPPTPVVGGQGTRTDSATNELAGNPKRSPERLDSGILNNDRESSRSSELHLPGPGSPINQDGGGGRRRIALSAQSTGSRQAQGEVLVWTRVESVEVLEPGSDGTFGGVCPDGLVYNFEIAGTHTYVADGFVVHNCHTLPSDTYYRVSMSSQRAYFRFGLSGTPLARGDRRSLLAIASTGPIIYRIQPDVLIAAGVLAKPRIQLVPVAQLSDCKTWQGVYGECIVRSRTRNQTIVDCARKAEKPCLVFVKEIQHGRLLTERLLKADLRAEFVFGADSTPERQAATRRLVRGDLDVLVSSVIFQEGVDIPQLRSVVIANGGKSVIAALQRIGRGMRVAADKSTFQVFDVADHGCKLLERHTRARVKAYASQGYETVEAML